MKPLLATLTALALTTPSLARADDPGTFLFSGAGMAPGTGRLGFDGGAILLITGDGDVVGAPILGVHYARGLVDRFDLRLSLNTIFLYNDLDVGMGIALIRTDGFDLGLRAGFTSQIIFADGVGGVVGAVPGAVATLGGEAVAVSVGVDFPIYFNGFYASFETDESGAASGVLPAVRPNVALEIGAGDGGKFFLRGEAVVLVSGGGGAALAVISAGGSF